ncbi:hypothetical protein O6H91_13G043700 [Diphasiastrum complanatum]|uniref:Uncharacterized protein n=1 Tax=Diphasiastrum complanatum TaxID=34168 RepID=A0ACC2BUA1_DIPCM|nr:hypothetical protein O6H91_13G043700 [Diphasiastrum complanatum]
MGRFRIKVYLRLRPSDKPSPFIHIQPTSSTVQIDDDKHAGGGPPKNYTERRLFRFDGIIQSSSQEAVFDECAKGVVEDVLTGYHGTIFAYGQVGSGKTFTMTGETKTFIYCGLIPRCIHRIFEEKESKPAAEIKVHVSYLEIHNEVIYDLLAKREAASQITTLEEDGTVEFRGLTRVLCTTEEQALKLFFEGERHKAVAVHPLNQVSSRSHCMFTLYVERHAGMASIPEKTAAKLNLVDLAGFGQSKGIEFSEQSKKEIVNINKSLIFLEQISSFRFAQFVQELNTNAIINKLLDPTYTRRKYERQISDLKQELALKDALNGRTDIAYDLTDEMKSELRARVNDFLLQDAEVETIPVDNLKQVREIFKLFREAQMTMLAKLEVLQKELRVTVDVPMMKESITPTLEEEVGVGELDNQGFHVGVAPVNARPDSIDGIPSKMNVNIDDVLASTLFDQQMEAPKKVAPNREKKNKAFIYFKHHTSEGNEYENFLKETRFVLRLKRKLAQELCNHINEVKFDIANLNKDLKEFENSHIFENPDVTNVDKKVSTTTRLQVMKAEYRRDFNALNKVKHEILAIQQKVKSCKQNILEFFYKWLDESDMEDVASSNFEGVSANI